MRSMPAVCNGLRHQLTPMCGARRVFTSPISVVLTRPTSCTQDGMHNNLQGSWLVVVLTSAILLHVKHDTSSLIHHP